MNKTRLKRLLFAVALASLLVSCVAIVWQSRWIIQKTLTEELIYRGVGIAQSVAGKAVAPILERNDPKLTELVFDEMRLPSRRGIVDYVVIMDDRARFLAHTFVTEPPYNPSIANPLPVNASHSVASVFIDGHEAFDVAVPITEGAARLGVAHIGLSLQHIQALMGRLRTTSIGFILAFGVLVFIVSFWLLEAVNRREAASLRILYNLQRERIESLRKLASAIAHQLRNPVMIIGGFANLLTRKPCDEERRDRYATAIKETAGRLESIITGVRDLSAIHVERVGVELPLIGLQDVCEAARRLAERETPRSPDAKPVEWDIFLDGVTAHGDAGLLTLAFKEIFCNSLEALGDDGGHIHARAAMKAGVAEVVVEDDGPGPSEPDIPFVFDPFFTSKPIGVGVGLAKTKRVVEEHGGEIAMSRRSEGGARTTVRLPVSGLPRHICIPQELG